jgi:hypothetical protein
LTAARLFAVALLAVSAWSGCRVAAPPSPPTLAAERYELSLQGETRREEPRGKGRTLAIARSIVVRGPGSSHLEDLVGRARLQNQLDREPLSADLTLQRISGVVEVTMEAAGVELHGEGHLEEVVLLDRTALHPTLLERTLALELRRGDEVVGRISAEETGALLVRLGAVEHHLSPTGYDIGYLDLVQGQALGYVTAAPRERPTERIAWLPRGAAGERARESLHAYFLALLVHDLVSQRP